MNYGRGGTFYSPPDPSVHSGYLKMDRETVQITLPFPLARFVQDRVHSGGYQDANDYFESLIRADLEQSKRQLEAALLEGLDSGPARKLSDQDWEALKDRVRADAAQNAGATE
jgi:antitoxin ParD1/3/4